jgi:hypothetical protein
LAKKPEEMSQSYYLKNISWSCTEIPHLRRLVTLGKSIRIGWPFAFPNLLMERKEGGREMIDIYC